MDQLNIFFVEEVKYNFLGNIGTYVFLIAAGTGSSVSLGGNLLSFFRFFGHNFIILEWWLDQINKIGFWEFLLVGEGIDWIDPLLLAWSNLLEKILSDLTCLGALHKLIVVYLNFILNIIILLSSEFNSKKPTFRLLLKSVIGLAIGFLYFNL